MCLYRRQDQVSVPCAFRMEAWQYRQVPGQGQNLSSECDQPNERYNSNVYQNLVLQYGQKSVAKKDLKQEQDHELLDEKKYQMNRRNIGQQTTRKQGSARTYQQMFQTKDRAQAFA